MLKPFSYSVIYLFFTTCFLYSQEKKSIDSLVTDFSQDQGLVTTYQKGDELYFEIQDSLLGKDLLMVTRYVQLPSNFNPYTNAGSKSSQLLVRFTKQADRILFTQHSFINTAEEEDPISLSVQQNNFPPILGAFKIKNKEKDRYFDCCE